MRGVQIYYSILLTWIGIVSNWRTPVWFKAPFNKISAQMFINQEYNVLQNWHSDL